MSTEKKETKNEIIRQKLLELQSEARTVRKIVLIIAIVLFLAVCIAALGGYIYIKSALKPVDPDSKTEKNIEIPIGSSVSGIAQVLEDDGIIKDARVFKYYVKFKNESGFMAGDYKLKPSMSIPEIIERLKTGKAMQEVIFKITIPEGKQLKQIAGIIAEKTNKNEEEVFNKLNDKSFVKTLMAKYPDILTDEIMNKNVKYPLEGYLFPATYPFYKEHPTIEEIVSVMLDKTKSVLKEYTGQMEKKQYSVHQLLTMASLIEEEATEKADRDRIASVFYNRIKTGMPLQTDPTVLYAKGKHQERVLYEDLEVDSPYNTYKHKGLPPGPIANAGTMSIEAALNPEKTDFLYFLATADGDVIFTKTLDEHNKAKAEHITNN
ncbi:aminodeoxychorismate lyase [Bacillus methanolicus PB1]|uniref:Endolytic murein transglycosylase n=1 Tax=Bacillus methanolicus PB1 TaxID=997296 RepID=I3DXK3_BACMT|nr:endolytic transglycosylase MltG [Bacillus methanolicus]EIJ78974.1 aminodeoxychorismate lyase [Bacillus methanolicus PB1]